MTPLPRIAIGTIQPRAERQAMVWALTDVLSRKGINVQLFHSRADFSQRDVASPITGLCPRHLDSWIMSCGVCRDLFLQASHPGDLALVEGPFSLCSCGSSSTGTSSTGRALGGSDLETLCQWLELPRLVIVDVSQINGCRLPELPPKTEGLFLDRISSSTEFYHLQTVLESLWGVPVLGALERLPGLRAALGTFVSDVKRQRELSQTLGSHFARYFQSQRVLDMASSRVFPELGLGRPFFPEGLSDVCVAVAYDEAFHRYFPDTLDFLELYGAKILDFSPLRDDSLPPGTDIVYLGCGHPELYAETLASNHCMALALRNHACEGRRIYAEGGGLAYLCRSLESQDRRSYPAVGALPAVARFNPCAQESRPVEIRLAKDSWLGNCGTSLRGYRNSSWQIEAVGPLTNFSPDAGGPLDLVGRRQVVGSRLVLNFVARADLLRSFLQVHTPAFDLSSVPSSIH